MLPMFFPFSLENSKYYIAVRIEDTDKAIGEVTESFDGVEEVTAQQRGGIVNYIQRKDILSFLTTGYGSHFCSSYYLAYAMRSMRWDIRVTRRKSYLPVECAD